MVTLRALDANKLRQCRKNRAPQEDDGRSSESEYTLMDNVSDVSLNARGMNSFEKRQKIYDWLRDSNVHIALIKKHIILKRMNLNILVVGLVKYFMLFQIPPMHGVSQYYLTM